MARAGQRSDLSSGLGAAIPHAFKVRAESEIIPSMPPRLRRPPRPRSTTQMSDTQQRIDQLVKSNNILLFMKGSASFPMCGFSGRAIQILKACGVEIEEHTSELQSPCNLV